MSKSRRLPAVRTAAVGALAGGALLLPATGAFAATPAPAPAAHGTVRPHTPEGGVRAGTDGLKDSRNPAFLVAGGGMAAAGAAGLGFAMLRRGRTDG
ncbi:hypothetical protein [Streptomyces lasiicapitis]|uniref:LPXTG cell wall anchor domain-containing protein n=1 Tax=Streptomyces lasiicapitis TaxID=1923961 RepID=A0ABQ2LH03_9ACTN|nr:hypothetical protein [Streptomyces lasiicapitis]GGO33605.1 hypothetical protein GCM10012286_01410 [Streptomyces lasiicapitis]